MTATTTTRPAVKPRRPLRLSAMEVLGFIDGPGTSSASTGRPPTTRSAPARRLPNSPSSDPFADWVPAEFGNRLTKGGVRWGLFTTVLLLVVALVGTGYWAYRRPAARVAEMVALTVSAAEQLAPELRALEAANQFLVSSTEPGVLRELLSLESAARGLFDAAGSLPASEGILRSTASDGAIEALDATRLYREAVPYKSAVVQMIAVPEFETDAAHVGLDEAARQFGEWQAQFDSVLKSLPEGTLSSVTSELESVSNDLHGLLTRYLDALRNNDRLAAAGVISELGDRLDGVEKSLNSALADVQTKIAERLAKASASLALLLG